VRKVLVGLTVAAVVAAFATAMVEPVAAEDAPGGLATPWKVCKSKPESECGATEGCIWIAGYIVGNGVQVPGYCRPAAKDLTAKRGTQAQPPKAAQ